MTKEEALKRAKPMLFNTAMMTVNLNGTKCVTRRLVDKTTERLLALHDYGDKLSGDQRVLLGDGEMSAPCASFAKFHKGDVIYARETFAVKDGEVIYRAGYAGALDEVKWTPSLHMLKAYTRYIAVIENVGLERIQSADPKELLDEGLSSVVCSVCKRTKSCAATAQSGACMVANTFRDIFDATVDKNDIAHRYAANPWVFVYRYKRLEVESEG